MELCNIHDLRELLSRHDFHFSKAKGQNFLVAPWVPERIAEESGTNKGSGVLEIGPGVGCLTERLAQRAGRVVAVELDKRLLPVLGETMAEHNNVEIVNGDIMKLDLGALVSEKFSDLSPAVCANLPYNITTPVLTRLMDVRLFTDITVMIQKEVAQRICARPGSSDYGAFSVYVNFHAVPEILFDVPPSCFEPKPKVTSSVIRLRMRTAPPISCDESLFFRIVRASFAQRRKTLLNGLSAVFSPLLSKEQLSAAVLSCGFDERVRGETMGIKEFAALTNALEGYLS